MASTDPTEGWDLISVYTRAQALADGVLVDVSETAREAGFTVPVAMTIGLWTATVAWDEENGRWQDEKGRLWDVLSMARFAIRAHREGPVSDRCPASVLCVENTRGGRRRLVDFVLHSGPGDDGEHVMTFMLPGED